MWATDLNLLELTCPTPHENLACDEALLLQSENAEGGYLRVWESSRYAVILGRSNRVREDVEVEACRRDGIPILRRCSGGGTVLLGPGCLLFTLVLPVSPEHHLQGIPAATAAILRRIAAALEAHVPGIELCGTSDLVLDDRKFSGNSQRWRRTMMMHHGTLLYDFEIDRVSRYLKSPKRQPDYRDARPHDEFLTNLPIGRDRLRQLLINAWQANHNGEIASLHPLTAELARTRYSTDDWNLRL